MNIAIITLDSLRYDVFEEANLPYLKGLGDYYQAFAQGTDTLLSHLAIFKYGHLPVVWNPNAPDYLRYPATKKYMFK